MTVSSCVFGIMVDNDVDGLAIARTYIHTSQRMQHHPDIIGTALGSDLKLLGLKTSDMAESVVAVPRYARSC